jgi:glycosyltransferase involved in cell wall biosynthesis
MKVLLIGIFKDGIGNTNCGYSNAVSGMYEVLKRMEKEKKIDCVDALDATNIGNLDKFRSAYDISISFIHPSSFLNANVLDRFKMIFSLCKKNYLSVVFETKPLPKMWGAVFTSGLFDGFVAPSNFILDQLPMKNKYYLPHYIDVSNFERVNIDEKEEENIFKCLFVGQYTKRKGIKESILTFARVLGDKPDCKLIIKYHEMSKVEIPIDTMVKNYMYSNCLKPKAEVYTIDNKLDFEDLKKLYRDSSLFMGLSRGEGFGLSYLESVASGIPIIYTNWSGVKEVSVGAGNIPVDYYLDSAYNMTHHGYEHNLQYAYPKIKDAESALRNKYEQWKNDKRQYYEEVANNYKLIDSKFGYKKLKECFTDIFKGV